MLMVSSTMATRPVARVVYHSGLEPVTTRPRRWPAPEISWASPRSSPRSPSGRTSRAGSPASLSQPAAASPRTIAAVLAVLASSAASRRPRSRCASRTRAGLAGGRVDDVVDLAAARRPGPHGGAGGGQAAVGDGHGLARRLRPGGVVVGDPDPPAVRPAPGPATARSPPRLTRTPQPRRPAISSAQRSAAQALAVAPRSSWAPREQPQPAQLLVKLDAGASRAPGPGGGQAGRAVPARTWAKSRS